MEKLVTMWMETQIKIHVPQSVMSVQAKARKKHCDTRYDEW
jgi:hypothetical protein